MIVSDKVLPSIIQYLSEDIFELTIVRRISKWLVDYYVLYQRSPKEQIEDLYLQHKSSLTNEESEEIREFLTRLSAEYVDNNLNEEYLKDQAIAYCKKQYLIKMAEQVKALSEAGKVEEAEQVFKLKTLSSQSSTFEWVAPLDDIQYINRTFDHFDEEFLKFHGDLGELIGPIDRGWLMGVMGPMKRGKTFQLQNLGVEAILNGKKVAFISCEMTDKQMSLRIFKQIGSFGFENKNYKYPIFDCEKNQKNICTLSYRVCRTGKPQDFTYNPNNYVACSICRDNKELSVQYIPAVWYVLEPRPKLERKLLLDRIKKFRNTHGRNLLRLISFPRYTAQIKDIENALDFIEIKENFIPDVIIVDYAEILAPEHPGERRHQIDSTWMLLGKMAVDRHALVITGTQTNRGAIFKQSLDPTDTAEDIRKMANVDLMIALNQTPTEKREGIMRINLVAHRHKDFDIQQQVMTLLQLEVSQPSLDGEMIWYKNKEDE